MNKLIIVGVLFVGLIGAFIYVDSQPGQYDDFAQCLSDEGAKMYGAFWCPHCNTQKANFGKSFNKATYIECSTPDRQQTTECAIAGIQSYPTWEFADGSRANGVLSFNQLSEVTGCELPE